MVSVQMSGSVCQDSLSIHSPCLLPNHVSGWASIEVVLPCEMWLRAHVKLAVFLVDSAPSGAAD